MIIKLENLTKSYKVKEKQGFLKSAFFPKYKSIVAVNDVSFEIEKGESVALLGPNGAGKTTIMKMLSGLLYPSDGKVDVLGYFPFDRKKEFLKMIGLVMGNKSGLAWDLTPMQNFELTQKIYQIDKSAFTKRLNDFAEILSSQEYMDKQVRKLSLGERMKMELLNSILHNPDVLFLDEPTIGLDIISKKRIRKFLREIQKTSDITMLLTSHDMDDVERVSDRVIIINEGKKIYDDSMDNLLVNYKNKKYITLRFTKKVSSEKFINLGHIVEIKPLEVTLEIETDRQTEVITKLLKSFPVDDIDIIHVPLEEIIEDIFTK